MGVLDDEEGTYEERYHRLRSAYEELLVAVKAVNPHNLYFDTSASGYEVDPSECRHCGGKEEYGKDGDGDWVYTLEHQPGCPTLRLRELLEEQA